MDALGIVETKGFGAAAEAANAMAAFENVRFLGYERSGGGYVAAIIRGEPENVEKAVNKGGQVAEYAGDFVGVHFIPEPHGNLLKGLTLANSIKSR